ncbi:putative baseplate wedge tail fiber connector [Escherichia phage vB_EcoM_ESCO47]|nr:putative baseplate wedge tail fiber connector [Escherichia phage vB_EcoM_ESCO47]
MAFFRQTPKQLIDTGEIGNASTGDILFDGGNKINDDINAIYNAFGDQRKMATANGTGPSGQTIYATGYYQKGKATDYQTPVAVGTMHDIDTTEGGVIAIVDRAELGDSVEFINSNGSISVNNPLSIQVTNGSIKGVLGNLVISTPFTHVVLRCISSNGGESVWNYSIDSMFGQKESPVDGTWSLTGTSVDIPLFYRTDYNTAKLLVTCQSTDGRKIKTCEINILIDAINSQVLSTEYAVMRVGNVDEADEIANISFAIVNNFATMTVTSSIIGLRTAVKVISTQKIGVAQ